MLVRSLLATLATLLWRPPGVDAKLPRCSVALHPCRAAAPKVHAFSVLAAPLAVGQFPRWSACAHASPHSSWPCTVCAGATKSHSQSRCDPSAASDGDRRPEARAPWCVAPHAPGASAGVARRSCGAGGAARVSASGCSVSLHAVRSGVTPPPPSCLSSAQASRAWERLAWSTATCTTPSARPFRRALACRRASRPQQPAPPRDTRGRRNPVTVTRLSPACHLADHRGVVRDEEGGGQRQNLQPRHLGHCRPGAPRQ